GPCHARGDRAARRLRRGLCGDRGARRRGRRHGQVTHPPRTRPPGRHAGHGTLAPAHTSNRTAMNDRPVPPDADADLVGAYLDADLDAGAVEAFERRLADDDGLLRRLEAVRALREALAGDTDPPAGYTGRLRAR